MRGGGGLNSLCPLTDVYIVILAIYFVIDSTGTKAHSSTLNILFFLVSYMKENGKTLFLSIQARVG